MRKTLLLSLFTLIASAASLQAGQQASTLAQLKACVGDEVEFTLPANAVISGTGSLTSANIIFLWDGTDGVKLVFDTADGDIFSLVQQRPIGHRLTGFIFGRYEPNRVGGAALVCNYGWDKTNYYRELTLSDEATELPAPAEPTIAQLLEATVQGMTDYDNAYVRVAGGFMLTDAYKLFDDGNRSIAVGRDYMGIDAQGEYAHDFSPAVGKQGLLSGICEVDRSQPEAAKVKLSVVDADHWWLTTGDIVATETITLDASPTATNTYGEERPGVNVQVLNVHYKAGGYYPFYLPLDIDRDELLSVFGADTRLYGLSNVGSRINGKQIMLYFETLTEYTQTSAWRTFMIRPSQDVTDPIFHNVHFEKSDYVMVLRGYAGNNTHGNIYYYNTINPVTLLTDGTHRLIRPDATIAAPEEGQNAIGAFTAYLDLSQWYDKHPDSEPQRVYITIDGEEIVPSGIGSVVAANSTPTAAIYSLSGQRVETPSRGVYVVGRRKVVR